MPHHSTAISTWGSRDIGTSVFAGMLVASTIGIFLIPMLYVVFQRTREWSHGRFALRRKRKSAVPPPLHGLREGEVSPSYGDGGIGSRSTLEP